MNLNTPLNFVRGSRLRNRFALFGVVLAVVPVLGLGAISLLLIDLAHRQDVSQLELQLIDQKIKEIEKFFADTLGILELRVGFTQKAEIELSQQNFLLEGLLEENKAFEEVSFTNLSGIETAKKFRAIRDKMPQEAPALLDVSRLLKFQEAAKGKNFIGETYYTLSGPAITLAAPVYNRNSEIIQVLAAEVNLAQVVHSIEKAHLGVSGYLALVDKNGSLIAHVSPSEIQPGTDLSQSERIKRLLGGATLDALGEKDRYLSFLHGVPVVGAGKKMTGTGWILLAEWPLSDADALIRDIRNEIALLALFSVLAVMFVAPFFASRLIQPIKTLEAGAAEIAKGNFEKRIAIKTDDELEDLGGAFNKMAEGLKKLKELQEEFVFIAAHDLRAPVTVIKGYASMIVEKSSTLPEDIKEYIGEIERANKRLLQLVQDLLEVARSEAGRIVIKLETVDIRIPVREVVAGLKLLADEKSLSLAYEETPEAINVLANGERIKEVMTNLVNNAIKYTGTGGQVRVFHEIKDNSVVTHIQDNGFGISKEAQKKIFEKFYRVQTKDTQDIEGTGLGLFIVKQLVEKMNGTIWFESEEGKGSTFSFSLKIYG